MVSIKKLTEGIKSFAINEGANLVGISSVDRFKNAPLLMNPQGHLPSAKSVISICIHIPDGCVEFSGEPPYVVGPYTLTNVISKKLDCIAFKLAQFLEGKGYATIPIAATGYYKLKHHKGPFTPLVPDISHIHMAVAAGLGEFGWSGLLLTPQYGPRQRCATIITEAPLLADPLYGGEALCDRCMECVRNCPAECYTKEVGRVKKVNIGGKTFKYANINMLRCGWRHEWNMDIEIPIPSKIDKEAISKNLGHAFEGYCCPGPCLRYCMPPSLRIKDPDYCRAPRRRKQLKPQNVSEIEAITEKVKTIVRNEGMDFFSIVSQKEVKGKGIDTILPDAESFIIMGIRSPMLPHQEDIYSRQILNPSQFVKVKIDFAELAIIEYLEELGYTSIPWTKVGYYKGLKPYQEYPRMKKNQRLLIESKGLGQVDKIDREILTTSKEGKKQNMKIVVTNAPLIPQNKEYIKKISFSQKEEKSPKSLTERLRVFSTEKGIDLFGIASVQRIKQVLENLQPFYPRSLPMLNLRKWGAEYDEGYEEVKLIKPEDYLPQAKSIMVVGVHYPDTPLERAYEPPIESIGPFVFAQHQALLESIYIAIDLCCFLDDLGYKAVPTLDLCGVASRTYGYYGATWPDFTCNRYAAIAAGLGELGWHGLVLTPQYGARQRFIAIVTDALLEVSPLYQSPPLCKRCFRCVEASPSRALSKKEKRSIKIEDRLFEYGKINQEQYDWSKRYGLMNEEGPKYLGSNISIKPPENITPKKLSEAFKQINPVLRGYLAVVEKCVKVCPAGK